MNTNDVKQDSVVDEKNSAMSEQEKASVCVGLETKISGRFKLTAFNPETGKTRVLADWFDNLILNQGLDQFASTGYLEACQVGSGTTAPANTQTGLTTFVAGTSNVTATTISNSGTPDYFGNVVRTYRFAQGAAAGNLSEVGVGKTATGNTLFSRARILDGAGMPTTITVLAIEFLDVTYEFRHYPPLIDSSFNFVMSAVTYACVARGSTIGAWTAQTYGNGNDQTIGQKQCYATDGVLGLNTGAPTGSIASLASVLGNPLAYTPGSFQIDNTTASDINQGNLVGGIKCIVFTTLPNVNNQYQVSFSPAINKDNTKTLSITFRQKWARKILP